MLNNLKIILGIDLNDASIDDKLNLILSMATARLKRLLGDIEPPESMNDIILNVSIKRFNRIGSEGLSSHSQEGESLSFSDNDFDEYKDDIKAFLEAQDSGTRGRLRFI